MGALQVLGIVMLFTFLIILFGLVYWVIYLSNPEVIKSKVESEVPDSKIDQIQRQQDIEEKRLELEKEVRQEVEQSQDHAFRDGYYYIQYDGGCEPLCNSYLSWVPHPLTGVFRLIVRNGKTTWKITAVPDEPHTYYIQEQSSCRSGMDNCGAYVGIAGERKKEGDEYKYEGGIGHIDTLHGGLDQSGNEIKDFRFTTEKVKIYSHPQGGFALQLADIPTHSMMAEPYSPENTEKGWVSFFNDPSSRWKFTLIA